MGEKTRTQYSLINIGVGFAGYFLNTLLGFVCRMVFTRTLSADYLGVSGLFKDIFTLLSLAELGIGSAIAYALYKPLAEKDEDKISALMQFYGKAYRVIGCAVGLIGVGLMPFLKFIIQTPPNIHESIYLLFGISIFNTVLTYFFSYRSTILVAAQKNYYVIGLNYLVTAVQSLIQIGVLLISKNYLAYLMIQTVGTVFYNFAISHLAKKQYPCITQKKAELSTQEKKSLTKNIKALMITKVSEVFVYGIDNVVITFFNGLTSVGMASNYTLLSNTLSTLTNQVFNSLTASVGNLNAIESDKRKKEFFYTLNLANFWVFGWAAIGIAFVSGDLVGVFFGKAYILSQSIPFILALNFYIVTMQSAVTTYRSTLGLFYYGRYLVVFTAVLNIVLSLALGHYWGVFGIYLATVIARLLTNVWYMPYSVFKYGLHENPLDYFKVYVKYGIVQIVVGVICYFVCTKVEFSCIVNAVLKILLCSVITNGVYWLVFHKTDQYRYLEGRVRTLVKNAKHRAFLRRTSGK